MIRNVFNNRLPNAIFDHYADNVTALANAESQSGCLYVYLSKSMVIYLYIVKSWANADSKSECSVCIYLSRENKFECSDIELIVSS